MAITLVMSTRWVIGSRKGGILTPIASQPNAILTAHLRVTAGMTLFSARELVSKFWFLFLSIQPG